MIGAARRVGTWLQAYPHTLISFCIGLGGGMAITMPFGWRLPDSSAALIGAMIGAGAAVGGALWAANAKQRQEELKTDEKQEQVARMIASAIAEEVAVGQRIMNWQIESIRSAIGDGADADCKSKVLEIFRAVDIEHSMCKMFADRLDAFGVDAPLVMDAVASILSANATNRTLAALINDYPWSEVKIIIDSRVEALRLLSSNLRRYMTLIAKYHPAGGEILKLIDSA